MAIPKSQALKKAAESEQAPIPQDETPIPVYAPGEPIKVKHVPCYNDFVAILQFRIESTILVTDKSSFKQEGMVVGFGPGLPNGLGRCPSQLSIGEVVSFFGNPTLTLSPATGVYAGQKVIILPERSLICRLPDMPFERVDEKEVAE